MWFLAAIAAADPIEAHEALSLGPPLTYEVDAGVLRLEWNDDDGGRARHDIDLASIQDVRVVPDVAGPHLLLLTTSGGSFVLERGPCLLLAAIAPRVALSLDRPLVDGPICDDPAAESIDWLEQRAQETTFTHVEVWNDAVLADVRVTERPSGEPALDVQRGLVGVRPMLGHCFSLQQASGRAGFDAIAKTNGSLSRVNATSVVTGVPSVDGCLVQELDEAALPEPPARKRKVHIEVSAAHVR